MHYVSFPFFHYICYIYIFLGANPYTFYFITLVRYLNNEHEDNHGTQPKFDFEKMPCTNDIGSKEYMNDKALPLEMRRLINQENK